MLSDNFVIFSGVVISKMYTPPPEPQKAIFLVVSSSISVNAPNGQLPTNLTLSESALHNTLYPSRQIHVNAFSNVLIIIPFLYYYEFFGNCKAFVL